MGTTALSREEQVREILKCGKDPVYFMKRYVKIQHPKRGIIPFETYSFQDDCVKAFEDFRFNIVLKSRQLGLSTVSAAYAAWLAIFHRDKTVLVIATKLPTAMNFIKKIRVILTNVPAWLLLPKFEPTKQAITFNNGSSITAIPTSDDAGRSEALSLLIVDEAAFIRDFEDIWTGLSPTISTGGRAIIISTPNGVGGQYYKLWTDAEAHVNDFNAIKLSWTVHPEHDEEWFKNETKSLSRRKIAQEYLCIGTGSRVVTTDGYTEAENVRVGDMVLTHRGRFRPVTRIAARLVKPEENLYHVSSSGNAHGFLVTGNHPALSYRFPIDAVAYASLEPSWIDFDTLASGEDQADRATHVVFPKLQLSDKLNVIKPHAVDVGFHLGKRVGQGIDAANSDVPAFVKLFVRGSTPRDKTLDLDHVMAAGKEFVRGLLYGYQVTHDNASSSSKLVYQLRTLASAFNLYHAMTCSDDGTWNLGSGPPPPTSFVNGHFVGHHTIVPVGNDGGLTVYDISVADDASFVVESAVLHNCDFISSGDTFLQPNDLEHLRTMVRPPIDKFGDRRDVWVWVHPQADRRYVVAADVSRGDARDFSAFHVIDTTVTEVVAEYMGKVPPEKLADILNEWGRKYNNALIVPENNSYGYFVCTKLRDTLAYPNMYYHANRGDPFAQAQVTNDGDKELPGFPTNTKTRIQILAKLEELIRNRTLKLHSQRLYDQLQSFIWNGSKPMATKDSYDDLVMALAIGTWQLEGRSGLNEQALAMSMAILKATTLERRDTSQMPGDIESAQPLVNPSIRGYNRHTVFRPRDASQVKHNDASDFSWLLR